MANAQFRSHGYERLLDPEFDLQKKKKTHEKQTDKKVCNKKFNATKKYKLLLFTQQPMLFVLDEKSECAGWRKIRLWLEQNTVFNRFLCERIRNTVESMIKSIEQQQFYLLRDGTSLSPVAAHPVRTYVLPKNHYYSWFFSCLRSRIYTDAMNECNSCRYVSNLGSRFVVVTISHSYGN